ncbi:MAG: hypothetical protein Kow0099_34050 [Candidatus Abyssubacteria bacterium]
MPDIARVTPQEAKPRVESGEALLVCGYEDEQKCMNIRLKGALTLGELGAKLASIPKDKEIIFYCM